MLPLTGIPPIIQSYGMRPIDIGGADLLPGVQAPLPLNSPSEAKSVQPGGESFANMLGQMVNEVNARQGVANDAVASLQSGQNASLHQAVIAMEEANISFQLMVEVRNKLLDSYQELMRMQI